MKGQQNPLESVDGGLVSSALETLGLPLWYVAERAGVHKTTIQKWKRPGARATTTKVIAFFRTVEALRRESNGQG